MVEWLSHVVVEKQLVLGQHAVLGPTEEPHHALRGELAWGRWAGQSCQGCSPSAERVRPTEGRGSLSPHPSAR